MNITGQQLGTALSIVLALSGAACSVSETITAEKLTKLDASAPKATPSPTSTPELNPLLPEARRIQVSDGVILGMAIQKVQPEYPLEAQAKGITGEVKIRISIHQEGHLGEAVPLSGHPLLQTAALAAVKQWRWRPIMYDGPPLYTQGTLTIHFPPRS